MKRNTWGIVVLTLVVAVGVAVAADWTDSFESYPAGQWPTSNWSPDGNSDGVIVTDIKHGGDKSFRLYGVVGSYWATLAHRFMGTGATNVMEFDIRNGAENIPSSGHQWRGCIDIHTGPSWTYPGAQLIYWHKNGEVRGRGGLLLGTYFTLNWYRVKVLYQRDPNSVHLEYWIDGEFKGKEDLAATADEMQYQYVALIAQAGTVWYDDVGLSSRTEPVTFGDGIWIGREFADYNKTKGEVFDEYLGRMLSELESHSITESTLTLLI